MSTSSGDSNLSADPIGGVGIYNAETKDSSGVKLENASINVKSTGARWTSETEYTQSVYGVYVGNGMSIEESCNLNVEASGNAYGVYATEESTTNLVGNFIVGNFSVISTTSSAYGIYAENASTVSDVSTVAVKASKEGDSAYGIYAKSNAMISDVYSITATSESADTAYGAYLDSGKISYSGDKNSSIVAENTSGIGSAYGIYMINNSNIYTLSSNGTSLSISATGNDAYGMYIDNSAFAITPQTVIEVNAEATAYGVYVSNSNNDSVVQGNISAHSVNGKAIGVSISNSQISGVSATISATSENVANSEIIGIEINSAGNDVNISGNISVDTTSLSLSKQSYLNMRAVETKASSKITFNDATLSTNDNSGIAVKSTGTDLTIAGTATVNGSIVAGTYSYNLGDTSDRYDINVDSGSFTVNAKEIYGNTLKLGSAETGVAEFNLVGRQTEFDINSIVFYAESSASHSTINANETEIISDNNFDIKIEFAEDFTFNVGDSVLLVETISPNSVTLSNLESVNVTVSVGDTILDSNFFAWKQISVGDKTGFGIEFTAVPEPAEWALIFGILAFGFIAYHRRK